MIMNGFFSAMKAIIWATVLLFVVLMIWSVVFVELIQPLVVDMVVEGKFGDDCDRCGRAFSSTMQAMLTFTQQIVAGDEWGAVSLPIIETHPWTAVFFSAVLVTVNLGLMNLILSVIVDKAQQAHNDDLKFQVQEKEEEFQKLKKQLLRICAQLDEDNSGCLTLDELLAGYDSSPEFHVALSSMDVQKEDILSLFNILDEDGSGHVEYDEFVDQLHKMKTQDSHVVLVFIRGSVKDIKNMMTAQQVQITEIKERLDASDANLADTLAAFRDRSPEHTHRSNSKEILSGLSPPQVYGQYQPATDAGCFGSCSPAPQEKSQDYMMAPSIGSALGRSNIDEELKTMKDNMAVLNSLLSRVLGAGDQQQLGSASQTLLVQPPVPAPQAIPSMPAACCLAKTPENQQELGIRPLPPGDMVMVQQMGTGGFGKGGKVGSMGKGKGGKKGGKV